MRSALSYISDLVIYAALRRTCVPAKEQADYIRNHKSVFTEVKRWIKKPSYAILMLQNTMKYRRVVTLSMLAAGILWLSGKSYLLIPTRMLSVSASLSSLAVLVLGGVFILAALANGMALFIAAKPCRSDILILLNLAMLALLVWLYLQVDFYNKGILMAVIIATNAFTLFYWGNIDNFVKKTLLVSVVLVNAVISLLIFVDRSRGGNTVHPLSTNFKSALAWFLLLSALTVCLTFFAPSLKNNWFLQMSAIVPLVLWIMVFVTAFEKLVMQGKADFLHAE